jgi:phosphatidate cytidylyltransferase
MHLKRIAVALIVIPALYFYVMYLPPQYFLFLLTLVSTLALAEFYAISGVHGALKYAGFFWGAALLVMHFLARDLFAGTLMLAALCMLTVRLCVKRDPSGAVREASAAVFGLFYVPALLSFQVDIVRAGAPLLVMLYAAVWSSDSLALYIGKGMGKRKLYAEISPNKTVAGAAGSFLGGIIGALLIKYTLLDFMPLQKAALLGLVVGVFSVVGDLVESMFKRDAGVKDSSALIPGHGGVLDKIDSVTFAGPAFYWCSLLLDVIR